MSVNFDKKKYLKSLRISEGERGYFDIKSLTKDSNIDINNITTIAIVTITITNVIIINIARYYDS